MCSPRFKRREQEGQNFNGRSYYYSTVQHITIFVDPGSPEATLFLITVVQYYCTEYCIH